jgi:hypothetical protein
MRYFGDVSVGNTFGPSGTEYITRRQFLSLPENGTQARRRCAPLRPAKGCYPFW